MNRRLHHVLIAALCLTARTAGAQDGWVATVDSIFGQFSTGLTPGAAVAVVRNGTLVLSKGYGHADLEHRVPITGTSVFDVASVSKQFAGLAIAMLVEQGKVALTDDIRKHIPELPDFGRTITVGHLVHHTSGLRDWPGTLALSGWRMDDVISFDQILTMAFHQRTLNFDPGAEYMYSNTGYNLLAELVRRVTGKSFRAWTDEQLFKPLGMTQSHFRHDHTEVFPDRVLGYARAADGTWRATSNNLMALGSSSLFTTAEDLAKWLANFDDARVGGSAIARMRVTDTLNDGSANAYAFGVSVGAYRGQSIVSHSGSWASFATFVLHFPVLKTGIVVLANTQFNPTQAAYRIADIYLDSLLGPRPTPPVRTPAKVSTAALDRYTGLYRLGPGWYTRITREGDALKTHATREAAFPMIALTDSTFWIAGYNTDMQFRRTREGQVEMMFRGKARPRVPETSRPSNLAQFSGTYFSEELEATYHVEVRRDSLVMRHRRHGVIPLTWINGDDFRGEVWFMRSVEFLRDGGRVTGLSVTV
ncbi:MAG TPA: serine hydrolase domain-containing protein, partial [Gemmatimonadaceae bacterium]